MKKRYLFLLTLLLPLATMFSSGRAYAQTDTEYNFALAAIGEYGNYYITTDYAGTKYYLTADGTLTSEQDGAGFFAFERVTGGAFKTYGYLVDSGEKRFSNPVSSGNINDTQLNATTNNRHDWEAQVFFMNIEGKFAVRATNAGPADSGWGWVGKSFWTVKSGSNGPTAGYSFDVNYIWVLEDEEGNTLQPTDVDVVKAVLNGLYDKYGDYIGDYDGWNIGLGIGTDYGQYSDAETWAEFTDLLDEVDYVINKMLDDDYDYDSDPDALTPEEAQAMVEAADSMYQKVLDSVVPYTPEEGNGYYRIIAHNRYKSKYDESGFVDKAIAASFSADHKGKAVYGTLRRDLANYLWKLTKSEDGDSIMIQNAGMGTYISFSSDNPENKVIMTEDASDASCVMFDYAGLEFVMPDGIETDKNVFAIRLAGKTREDNRYIHQMGHSSVTDDTSPWGNYGTDSGTELELGFWRSTWNYDKQADTWASEWFLEYVDDAEAEELIESFEMIKNHDVLVAQNNELRAEVLAALTTAKDVIKTKMITSASQMMSPFSHNDIGGGTDGGNLSAGVLIDGDKSTYWHSAWNNTPQEYHYIQISDMQDMVGDCEFYLCERAGASNDRPTEFMIYGTDDPDMLEPVLGESWQDNWNEIATLQIPNYAAGEESTVPFYVETPYPNIRVVCTNTDGSSESFRWFWHAAELQISTVSENPNSQFASLGDVAKTLDEIYAQNAATADEQITVEMYQALLDAYKAFLLAMVDPTELRTAMETYANVTNGVVEGNGPGLWTSTKIAEDYDALREEVAAYDKTGRYNATQNHKYAVMLKAMQKSVMEQANGVTTDKWYRIMVPTEEMYDAYGFSKEGVDKTSLVEGQATICGTFVATAKEESEKEVTGYDDDGNEVTKTNTWLEAIGGEDLREGNRLFFMDEDEIEDKDVSMFRFVENEADAPDYTSLFIEMKENMLMALDMSTTYTKGEALITDASQLSSNASDQSEGLHIEYAVDGNPNTFWHSDYHQQYLEPAYLQVALNEPVSGLIQVDITRRNNGYGHIVRMYMQGSNDANIWTNVGYLEAPYGGTPGESITCPPVDLGGSYKHLRFILTRRAGKDYDYDPFAVIPSKDKYDQDDPEGWTYFHVAEFQIYPVTPNTELSANGKKLQSAYTTLNKIVLKDATARDVSSAAQAYRTYRSEFNAAEGKDVLPYGKDKADPIYAIQNKATGLFVFVNGTGNQNGVYLKTIPTLYTYKALGFERSLLGGKNLAGQSTNYMHAGESNRRFCTWSTTEPTTNSGLVICEADETYAAPTEFTFYKDVKPGRIADWCHSVTLTQVEAPDDAYAYKALGWYRNDEGLFLALKSIETIPAGEPAFYIYGDTTAYDAEDDYVEPVKFKFAGDEKPVLEGKTVDGVIGTLVSYTLEKNQINFNGNYAIWPEESDITVTPCSAVVDLKNCLEVDPDGDYDFSICISEDEDVADGVKDISTAIENISKPGNVYSLDGKLLRSGATLNSLKAMGKGIYILNGVKVVVK